MNKEIKDVLQLLALILPVFALGIIGWLYSPMYAGIKAENRLNARDYLLKSYFFPNPLFDRKAMIEDYGFTDDEINPEKFFRRYIESQNSKNNGETSPNQNSGGLKWK